MPLAHLESLSELETNLLKLASPPVRRVTALLICLFAPTLVIAGDLPNATTFKVRVVRSSDSVDPNYDLLDVRSIRTEVTPSRRSTLVEVDTVLIATNAGQSTEIGNANCHTGGPYGPNEVNKVSEYAYVSCDRFPVNIYVPKGSSLTARVRVSTAEGALFEHPYPVIVLPSIRLRKNSR